VPHCLRLATVKQPGARRDAPPPSEL